MQASFIPEVFGRLCIIFDSVNKFSVKLQSLFKFLVYVGNGNVLKAIPPFEYDLYTKKTISPVIGNPISALTICGYNFKFA